MARQLSVVLLAYVVLFLTISSVIASDSPSTTFVQKTCNSTTYTNLCLNTLLPKADCINDNPKKATRLAILAILLQIGSTSDDITHLSQQSQLLSREVETLNECASVITSSFTGCLDAIQAIDQLNGSNNDEKESKRLSMEDDVRKVVRATNTCKTNLQNAKARNDVVSTVTQVTEPLVELATNGIDLIHHMDF